MKLEIDDKLCQGHAMCILAVPDPIDMDPDDGHAFVVQAEVPPELADAAEMARAGCPEQAVSLVGSSGRTS